jgi:protein dispatched 1
MLFTVCCILGCMHLFEWELGVIESVSATILVGLSVDYVVHLANSYTEAPFVDRKQRVVHALGEVHNIRTHYAVKNAL